MTAPEWVTQVPSTDVNNPPTTPTSFENPVMERLLSLREHLIELILREVVRAITGALGGDSPAYDQLADWAVNLVLEGGGAIIDAIVQTFLGLSGSGFSDSDLLRALQSIPASLITGTLPPSLFNRISIASLTTVIPELLTNGNFDLASSIIGQGAWTWDGTQGPPGLSTSVFTDATGTLIELFSNVIHVDPGQVLNLSGSALWGNGFNGGANSIALTVAKYDSAATLMGYDTIQAIASPGASGGWTTLSNAAYTVPSGVAMLFLRPTVSPSATTGRVWFGKMSAKPTATTMPQTLVNSLPFDLANRLLTNIFDKRQHAGSNLVISPDFEDATIGRNDSAMNVTYTTTQAQSGTHSITMPAHVNGTFQEFALFPTPLGPSENAYATTDKWIRVRPGQKFRLEISVYPKATNTATGTILDLFACTRDVNDTGAVSEAYPSADQLLNAEAPLGQWTRMSGMIEVPAGHNIMYPLAKVEASTPTGNIFYWDDAVVREITDSQNVLDTMFQTWGGVVGSNYTLDQLAEMISSLPYLKIGGYGGPLDIGSSLQYTWDQYVSGVVGTLGTGATPGDLFEQTLQMSSNAFKGLLSLDILGIRGNKSAFQGHLPTGVSNFNMDSIAFAGTAPTVPTTQAASLTAWKRIFESIDVGTVAWQGSGNASITDFRINIWKMDTSGNITCVHHSTDQKGLLGTTVADILYTLPSTVHFDASDVMGVEWHPIGAGTHNIVGGVTWRNFDHPSVVPRRWSSKRNGGTSTTTPSDIASASVDYATTNVPFFEIAVSGGNLALPHANEPHTYTTPGTASIAIPAWANKAYITVLGSGGKATAGSGTVGINGDGADAGVFGTATWTRGTDFTGATSISYTVPAGATSGAGSSASASITGHSVSGAGGAAGSGFNSGSGSYGASPGNQTYPSGGTVHNGGGQQTSLGGAGVTPGGGGAGGGLYQSGGNGANGAVWIEFAQ